MGECLITRRGGETYKVPILDENYPQDIKTTVIKGNTVSATFNVFISEPGNPAVYTYQWYVNSEAVEGANNYSYTMNDLSETATYNVYCEVTNKKGTVISRNATLEVTQYYTPVLNASYPSNANVVKGTSVTCNVVISQDGFPASYTYQWYKNNTAIQGATNSSYTFTPTVLGDTATLYCKVTNSAGTVTSRTATIAATTDYIVKNGQTSYSSYISSSNSSALSVSTSSGELYLKSTSYGYHTIGLRNIDLSNAKTLHLEGQWDHSEKGYSIEIYIASTSGSKLASKTIATPGTAYSFNFDVSNISGKCNLLGYFTYKGTWRIKNAYLKS